MWDFRNLDTPVQKMIWNVAQSGEIVNPVVNVVRFVPGQNLVLAGCSDENVSAKCFDTLSGRLWKNSTALLATASLWTLRLTAH